MARQVNLTVQCAGIPLAPGQDFQALLLHQSLFDHHSLSLVVPFDSVEGGQAGFLGKAPQRYLGQTITVAVEPIEAFALAPAQGFQFKGLVTELGTSKESDMSSSISVQGYSTCALLAEGVQKRIFLKQTLADIFKKVLAPYSPSLLAYSIQPQHQRPIAYVAQYRESNYTFLSRLAAEYGEWFFYDGLTLHLGLPRQDKELDFVADGVYNNFHLGLSLNSTRAKLYEYNYKLHQHFTASTQAQELPAANQNPLLKLALAQSEALFQQESQAPAELLISSASELNEEALLLKAQRAADLVALQGSSDNSGVQLGAVLKVKGPGLGSLHGGDVDFGTYRVVSVTHQLDAGGNYSNTFTALPHLLGQPPLNPAYTPPVGAQEAAEVIDTQDPDRLGRVRVRYYWPVAKPADAETDWLRTLTPYSGDGKGQLFTPEVGSQVLIGYENNLAEQPLVLGNLFHAQNKQGATYTHPANHLKGLQTAGGNKFVMLDTAGQQAIHISNSHNKGTAIVVGFHGDGSISLTSQGPVTVTGSRITLEAGEQGSIALHAKTISLVAEEEITLASKAKSISLAAKENIGVAAEKDVTLQAKQDLTLLAKANLSASGQKSYLAGQEEVHVKSPKNRLN